MASTFTKHNEHLESQWTPGSTNTHLTTHQVNNTVLETKPVVDAVVNTVVGAVEFDQADLYSLHVIDLMGKMIGNDVRFLEDHGTVDEVTGHVLVRKGIACEHCNRHSLNDSQYKDVRDTVKAALLQHLWKSIQLRLRGMDYRD